jgi:acetyl-CoA C-acetyltransferase
MTDVAIVDGARTPHGALLGSLADVSAVDLGVTALEGLVDKTGVPADEVDWVGLGNAVQAGVGQVPARQVVVESSLSEETPATTINEASGSGLRSIALAVDRIDADRAAFAIGGGMESMSNAPYLVRDMRAGRRHGNAELVDAMLYDSLWDIGYDAHMGELTEEFADRFDISREAQDEYAVRSNQLAAQAVADGVFEEEVVPVEVDTELVEEEEGPRPDTDLETLGQLPAAFEAGRTITAGNASKLSDGAGCVLVADAEAADEAGLGVMAHVEDYAVAYTDPKWFGMAPGEAVETLLERNDLGVDDVDVFELNEAFAAQMVYTQDRLAIPDAKLNPYGGAVALGHPIGASGGILTTTLLYAMEHEDATRGIVGMSIGGGGGIAMLLSR